MMVWFLLYLLVSILSFRSFSKKVSTDNNSFWLKFSVITILSLSWPVTWIIISVMVVSAIRKELKERRNH